MGLIGDYFRHSAKVIKDKRWPILRQAALRRDGYKCLECSAVTRLQCDHIKPVSTHPELSFILSNIQVLCVVCHSRKTRLEIGLSPVLPEREAWRKLVRQMRQT